MKRQDISRLSHNRSIYLKVGFIIAISFSILAFQWEVQVPDNSDYEIVDAGEMDIIENLPPRTKEKKKALPPPPLIKTVSTEIEDIDVVFTPEPVIETTEIIKKSNPDAPTIQPVVKKEIKKIVIKKPEPKKQEEPPIVFFAEQMPRFPGCEAEGLSDRELKKCAEKEFFAFLSKELHYPTMAREAGVKGTVVVQFVVNEDGELSDIEIVKDIGAGCGRESVRVAKKMPKWIPGKQRGQPVKVRMRLPIKFKLLD